MNMNVGDLIVDKEYPNQDWGLILDKRDSDVGTYRVLCDSGTIVWLEKKYVENDCEVISESR